MSRRCLVRPCILLKQRDFLRLHHLIRFVHIGNDDLLYINGFLQVITVNPFAFPQLRRLSVHNFSDGFIALKTDADCPWLRHTLQPDF